MYDQIVSAIRQGSDQEIIALFEMRASAAQMLNQLDIMLPGLHATQLFDVEAFRKSCSAIVATIDHYLRGTLNAVCRVGNDVIYAYAGMSIFWDKWGAAYGDLDTTEDGLTFINPALPGITLWGVFDEYKITGVLPPISLRHFTPDHPTRLSEFVESCITDLFAASKF